MCVSFVLLKEKRKKEKKEKKENLQLAHRLPQSRNSHKDYLHSKEYIQPSLDPQRLQVLIVFGKRREKNYFLFLFFLLGGDVQSGEVEFLFFSTCKDAEIALA